MTLSRPLQQLFFCLAACTAMIASHPFLPHNDVKRVLAIANSLRRNAAPDARYSFFDNLGGAEVHTYKRDSSEPIADPSAYQDSKRALDSLGGFQVHGWKRALDSLGGFQVHGWKRNGQAKRVFDSLGDGLVHGWKRNDQTKRVFDAIGDGLVHGYKRDDSA